MPSPVTLVQRQTNLIAASRLKARGVDELLARLYVARGVRDISEIKAGYEQLLPVASMKNVLTMADYLADCAVTGKRVLIISDYDCDGATACAVLAMTFAGCGLNFEYLVPDRIKHGYGLTPGIVDEAAALAQRPEVIITVDNGISSIAGVDRANDLGIEVLVTDHHLAPKVLPKARLIVNPNQPGCDFESKSIAGCGVAWYVARALVEELAARGMDPGFDPAELLSYVALGTVSDVVPLDLNNRILVAEGLKYIRAGHCAPGVLALARASKRAYSTLTCSDIGFQIGPRINAAGRLAHMAAGIECLTTPDEMQAHMLAKQLDVTNEERKRIQREMESEGLAQADALLAQGVAAGDPSHLSIAVFQPDWHEGVVGVVAGRLKETLHRPAVVLTTAADGTIKGSARSIPGFHLKHALDEINIKHPGLLLKFGGHAAAAGLTIPGDKLTDFTQALEDVCRANLTPEMLVKTLAHDGPLPARFFNPETVHLLSQQVWGQGFEEPVFISTIQVLDSKVIGEEKNHLKITGRLGEVDTDVLAFGQAELAPLLPSTLTVAQKPQINVFRGQSKLQMTVELVPLEVNPELVATMESRQALAKALLEPSAAEATSAAMESGAPTSAALTAATVPLRALSEPGFIGAAAQAADAAGIPAVHPEVAAPLRARRRPSASR
jgi:single-stranded-DNA-specific exonuclease